MSGVAKYGANEVATFEDAKLKYQRIITRQQALLAAQKIGVDINEITPIAIDVLWEEVALGRFLLKPESKNKGGNPNLQPLDSNEELIPTLEELGITYDKSSLLQKISKFSDDIIQGYIDLCVANKLLPKSADLKNNNTTISKMTGDNEGYTPREYIEMARRVMGSIDLDPASCDMAQEVVRASIYYTIDDDGLDLPWSGNIWLNPPYANKLITQFIDKITSEPITQAVVLTNNNTDTQWFKQLFQWASLVCFTTGRINFYKKDGTISAPTNGQCFFYRGDNIGDFYNEFKNIGLIMQAYGSAS